MMDIKRQFILVVQSQCVILDIKKNRSESRRAIIDSFEVNEDKMEDEILVNGKTLLDLVDQFMNWQYYSEPKPSWA